MLESHSFALLAAMKGLVKHAPSNLDHNCTGSPGLYDPSNPQYGFIKDNFELETFLCQTKRPGICQCTTSLALGKGS